jgi:DDE superfamily endonuclease
LSTLNSWRTADAARPADPETLAFAAFFTKPTWERALVLVAGAVLAPGRRTVTAALSVLGRRDEADFARFHGVLNRARWSGRPLARVLLRWLVAVFVPDGPVVVGIDETVERRWGPKISARGIYRDPVRSSHGHFVKGCAGSASCCWPRSRGPGGSGGCRS